MNGPSTEGVEKVAVIKILERKKALNCMVPAVCRGGALSRQYREEKRTTADIDRFVT